MIHRTNMHDFMITVNKGKVFIQTDSILPIAKITISKDEGVLVSEHQMLNTNFISFPLQTPGNYKVSIEINGLIQSKKIHFNN